MLEKLIFIICYFLLLFSMIGYGLLFCKIINNRNNFENLGLIGLFGLIFIGLIVTFTHFIIPINKHFNSLIILMGLVFFFLKIKNISLDNKKINIGTLFIIISYFMFYNYHPNEDFGYYHLPYIINFTQEKIIFGLSNLQLNQGWNSMWLNITSVFYLPFLDYRSTFILNSIFFVFVSFFFYYEAFENLNDTKILRYFSIFFLFFFIIKYSRLNSYGLDVPANYIFIVYFYFLLNLFFSAKNNNYNYFNLLILFSTFAISLRPVNALCFLPCLFYIFIHKIKILNLLKNRIFLFSLFFGIIWLLQQFIYTSCLIIPSKITCFQTAWFDPNIISNFKSDTNLINKSYELYEGPLTKEEYFLNFNWVQTWFFRHKVEIAEHILTFIIPIILAIIFNLKNFSKFSSINFINKNLFLNLIFVLFLIFIWFINAPVIRFGTHFIQIFIFILFYFFLLEKFNFSEKILKILLAIAIIFNISKNISRIKNSDEVKLYPHIQEIKYVQNKKGFNIPQEIVGKSKSGYCWSVPPICKIGSSENIEISNFKGYKMITILNF